MEPFERSRSTNQPRLRVPGRPAASPELGCLPEDATAAVPPPAVIRLEAPALFVEARFRDLVLASRLLPACAADTFTIGAAPRADAPVNPAHVHTDRHALVDADEEGGFTVCLSPAMRAELRTDTQRLPLLADAGLAEAPLVLPPRAVLHVLCGEMAFTIQAASAAAALPRPWLPSTWRRDGRYALGVAVAALLLLVTVMAVPSDPKALALDVIDASARFAQVRVMAPEAPPDDGGGGGQAAAGLPVAPGKAGGTTGQAGDRNAPARDRRLSVKGPADNRDVRLVARDLAAQIEKHSILGFLRAREGSALASVLADVPALGTEAETVLGDLQGVMIGTAGGVGGLGVRGTGAGGGDEGEAMLGGGPVGLATVGVRGRGKGPGYGYGDRVGRLRDRPGGGTPDVLPGIVSSHGSLDKEIIRRIVRRHVNEVRYCYEQALPRRPELAGRLVVGFTIAPNGHVVTSVLQTSSMSDVGVESCVVAAVRRWEFPQPAGGGLVMVSYPFQLAPAGG
jgi:hypothetical protein